MVIFKCDQCGKQEPYRFQHEINGYYPKNASGILIPETARRFSFCSHECIVKWMREALTKEPDAP